MKRSWGELTARILAVLKLGLAGSGAEHYQGFSYTGRFKLGVTMRLA